MKSPGWQQWASIRVVSVETRKRIHVTIMRTTLPA